MSRQTSVVPIVGPFNSAREVADAMFRCRDRAQASWHADRALRSSELASRLSLHSFALLALIPRLATARGSQPSPSPSTESGVSNSSETKDIQQEFFEILHRETKAEGDFDQEIEKVAREGLYQAYKPLLGTDWGRWVLTSAKSLEESFGPDDPVKALASCYRQFFHYPAQGNPWCDLLPARLVDDIWRNLWRAGRASARFGILGEGLDWAMGESPRAWPWPELEKVREALRSSSFDSTATLMGWLIADALAEEDRVDAIDQVLIRTSHPEDRVRGSLFESIARTEAGEAAAEPALTVFAGWLGTALRDNRLDWTHVVWPSFEECMRGSRATELMNIRDVIEWLWRVDLDECDEDIRFVGLLARACSDEEGLVALPSSLKNLIGRGMFRAADALLAASLLREVQSYGGRYLNVLAFVEYRALLPGDERLYVDRAIASLDSGSWGKLGEEVKNSFGRFIRVGSTLRPNETDLNSHDRTVRRYLQDAERQLHRAEQGEEEAAGHCILQLAKAAERYLNVGRRSLKGREFAKRLPLGLFLEALMKKAKEADELGSSDAYWYQNLCNDRALFAALKSLATLRNAATHDSKEQLTASDARSHWQTWVSEEQLLRLRKIVDTG